MNEIFILIRNKIQNIWLVLLFVFIPIFGIFFINNILLDEYLSSYGGIYPREFKFQSIIGIFSSWMFHAGSSPVDQYTFKHIGGNAASLFFILPIIAIVEKRPILTIVALILISGCITFILGSSHSIHIGASGLIFAIYGYMIGASIYLKKWWYVVFILINSSSFFLAIYTGIIPTEGISFAAHFGGLLGGILLAMGKYKLNLLILKIKK